MPVADTNHPLGRRIVLTTLGSLGDLHPFIAIALGLRSRGHQAVIATSNYYRNKIEALGLEFRALRPDRPDMEALPEIARRIMDLRKGSEWVIRDYVMPALRESYEDTLAAATGADLLVSHALTFTTPLVADKLGIPWASTGLQPFVFFSAYDPPVIPNATWVAQLRFLGPHFYRFLFKLARRMASSWSEPWHQLRAEIGLPPTAENPLFEGNYSRKLILALFSQLLAQQQSDWPARTVITGFPIYDHDGDANMPEALARFLDAGPEPIVFTLGSSAVLDAGSFYETSAAVAKCLGRRAVLLVGKETNNRPSSLPAGVIACDYAPFSQLLPRASAIVHQGGIGTTAQAMRSGRPMLVMPYAHDQPDNAARIIRLGIGRSISRYRYTPARATAALRQLLDDPGYAERARAVGRQLQAEDGVTTACDAIEKLFKSPDRGQARIGQPQKDTEKTRK